MMQLTLVLGSINAAHDLERRLRMPVPQFAPTSGPARRVLEAPLLKSHGSSASEQGGPTTPSPVDGDGPETATGQLSGDELVAAEEPFTPIPPPPSKAGADVGQNPTREPSRRFMGSLIGAFGVILALSLIWVAVGQLGNRAAPSPTSTVPIVLTVSTAKDFDPVVDGGSSHENARLIGRILDSSARSAWTTERYRGDPRLGGLKPGVGVVLDLGKPMTVSGVTVVLGGEGTSIELRVPAEDATEAPMRSHTQWRTVVSAEKASGSTNLTPAEPVTTRFLLLYLTSLPPVDGGYFQGSISALEVRG
ncbi:MAG: hypothetical protein IPL43_14670 [Micropruina sp.]|nr:hypothetical protein [Micropruina sp.]